MKKDKKEKRERNKEKEREKERKEKEKPAAVQMKGAAAVVVDATQSAGALSGRGGGASLGPLEGEQLSGLYPEIHRLVEELKWKMDSTLFSLHKQHRVPAALNISIFFKMIY
jgi:hypothetical protein